MITAKQYHAHVYFPIEDARRAQALHRKAENALAGLATVWPPRMRPVGPHEAPMFEIEFPHASRDQVLAWVEANHGGYSVLIHPETGDPLSDHRDHAVWLGEPLGLDLTCLEDR